VKSSVPSATIAPQGKIRQRFFLIVKGETPLSLEAQNSLIVITPKIRAGKTPTGADLQVPLRTCHVFHLRYHLLLNHIAKAGCIVSTANWVKCCPAYQYLCPACLFELYSSSGSESTASRQSNTSFTDWVVHWPLGLESMKGYAICLQKYDWTEVMTYK